MHIVFLNSSLYEFILNILLSCIICWWLQHQRSSHVTIFFTHHASGHGSNVSKPVPHAGWTFWGLLRQMCTILLLLKWVNLKASSPRVLLQQDYLNHLVRKPATFKEYCNGWEWTTLYRLFTTINTFRPALVLVPTGLSHHQSGVGTSTKPIFISLLKKKYWA